MGYSNLSLGLSVCECLVVLCDSVFPCDVPVQGYLTISTYFLINYVC